MKTSIAAAGIVLILASSLAAPLNKRPIIGILDQCAPGCSSEYGNTYIQADYVKFLEEAGARTVPVRVNQPHEYYKKILSHINGVLFTGGSKDLTTSLLAVAARIIYDWAVKVNNAGDYFPLWGTCQGFQLLTNLTADANLLQNTDAENISMALDLTQEYKSSRLLGKAGSDILRTLIKEKIAPNFHHFGVMEKTFRTTPSLNDFYRIISTNKDRRGKVFVSTMEAIKYPFYGTQWHPEMINYVWNPTYDVDHSRSAIAVTQYLANFFVNEARKSAHTFPDLATEAGAIMENYNPVYIPDGSFRLVYFFNFTQIPT